GQDIALIGADKDLVQYAMREHVVYVALREIVCLHGTSFRICTPIKVTGPGPDSARGDRDLCGAYTSISATTLRSFFSAVALRERTRPGSIPMTRAVSATLSSGPSSPVRYSSASRSRGDTWASRRWTRSRFSTPASSADERGHSSMSPTV